jgi:hypothetical protein
LSARARQPSFNPPNSRLGDPQCHFLAAIETQPLHRPRMETSDHQSAAIGTGSSRKAPDAAVLGSTNNSGSRHRTSSNHTSTGHHSKGSLAHVSTNIADHFPLSRNVQPMTSVSPRPMRRPSFAGSNAGERDLERASTFSSTGSAGRNESSPQVLIQPAAFQVGSSPRASMNPLENEAETLILKAIEQQDILERNHSRNDSESLSLLSRNVSPEAMDGFLGNGNAESDNEPMPSDVPSIRRYSLSSSLALQSNQNTEQALANLNLVMEAIQEEQELPESPSETSASFDTAHRVFHGNRRALTRGQSTRGESSTRSTSSEHAPPTRDFTSSLAARNWKKLRHAVQSTGASKTSPPADKANSKPNDDSTKSYREEEEAFVDLERIGERNVVSMPEPDPVKPMSHSNPSAKHSARRKMNRKMGSNGTFADLKLFVKQQRQQFFQYFKVLFLVVSAALIVSCLLFYIAGTYNLPCTACCKYRYSTCSSACPFDSF